MFRVLSALVSKAFELREILTRLQNYESHQRWTGPQILDQLPEIDIFCAGMGTAGIHQYYCFSSKLYIAADADSGTMTGVGKFLKQEKPDVIRVG